MSIASVTAARRRFRRWLRQGANWGVVLVALALLAYALFLPLVPQDPNADLAKLIARLAALKSNLNGAHSALEQLRKETNSEANTLRMQINSLEKEVERLRRDLASSRGNLAKLGRALKVAQNQLTERRNTREGPSHDPVRDGAVRARPSRRP